MLQAQRRLIRLLTKNNMVRGGWEQTSAARQCKNGRFGGFVLFFNSQGFTGSFGYCNGPTNAGEWNGTRR